MAEKNVPGGFLGAGGFTPPGGGGGGETLAQTYDVGAGAGDQTMTLADVKGGTVTIDAVLLGPLAGGARALKVLGGTELDATQTLVAAVLQTWSGNLIHGALTLTGGPFTIERIAGTFIAGVSIDGPGNTISDAYNVFIEYAPTSNAALTRSWGLGTIAPVHFGQGLVLRSNTPPSALPCAPPGESDLVISGDGVGVSATIVSEANTGRLGYEAGATQKFMVSMNGGPYVPLVTGAGTLASSYNTGTVAADQTLILTDAKGGAFILNGTTPGPGFTGVTCFEINVIGGSTNFYTRGGFDTSAAFSVVSAAGAVWDAYKFATSTVNVTGNTAITTAAGFNFATIQAPTIAGDTATCTITHAATLTILGAPIVGANVAITNPYAFWVQAGNTRLDGGQIVKGTDVNAAGPYVVTATDYMLEVRYTATGAISINLPALTGGTVRNGRIIPIIDSGCNAAVNPITFVLGNAADKIDNVNANYVQNVSKACIWLKANTTTNNWEFV